MAAKLSCAIWIETGIFIETLQMMWRKGLIGVDIQRMIKSHYPSEKVKRHRPDER